MFYNYVFEPYDEIYQPFPNSYKAELKENVNAKEGTKYNHHPEPEFITPQKPFDFKNIAEYGTKEFDYDLTNPEKTVLIGSKLTTEIMMGNL